MLRGVLAGRLACYGGRVSVGLPPLGACALIWWCYVRSGWCGGVAPSVWLVPLPFARLSASVSPHVLGVVALSHFLPCCQCTYVRAVAPAVEGVRGRLLVVRVR